MPEVAASGHLKRSRDEGQPALPAGDASTGIEAGGEGNAKSSRVRQSSNAGAADTGGSGVLQQLAARMTAKNVRMA